MSEPRLGIGARLILNNTIHRVMGYADESHYWLCKEDDPDGTPIRQPIFPVLP